MQVCLEITNTSSHKVSSTQSLKSESGQRLYSNWIKSCIGFAILVNIFFIILKNAFHPGKAYFVIRELRRKRKLFCGQAKNIKIARVAGKWYWDLYIPGWPSNTFNRYMEAEINRIMPLSGGTFRFNSVIFAMTKKCPLRCEHCFEWDALNDKEVLGKQDLKSIVQKFQEAGTSQLLISGGEPMLRVDDIVEVLQAANKVTEFWILSSGYLMTENNALKLKKAGLTGVFISLDHYEPEVHNLFRGNSKSYAWVESAVENAIKNELVVALTLCANKSFVSEQNLMRYADLAKRLGVSFIQILEPREVGHYRDKNASLNESQQEILERFYLNMNHQLTFRHYPMISYHAYHQRRVGCAAAADRVLYIDTDGDMHACPFCQNKKGNVLSENFYQCIDNIREAGCHAYENVKI